MLMVEQNARRCLQLCDRAIVLDQGRNAYEGSRSRVAPNPDVVSLYIGSMQRAMRRVAARNGDPTEPPGTTHPRRPGDRWCATRRSIALRFARLGPPAPEYLGSKIPAAVESAHGGGNHGDGHPARADSGPAPDRVTGARRHLGQRLLPRGVGAHRGRERRRPRLLRAAGPEHHVLQLRPGPQNAIDHLAFAVGSRRDVEDWARYLLDRKVELVAEPARLDGPGGGYGMRLRDPEGRVVELSTDVGAVTDHRDGRPAPVGLTHVVLNTTDIDDESLFYTDVLGFRVSDWSEHQMVFLRCNVYHHTIRVQSRGVGIGQPHGVRDAVDQTRSSAASDTCAHTAFRRCGGPDVTVPATTRSRMSPMARDWSPSTRLRSRSSTSRPGCRGVATRARAVRPGGRRARRPPTRQHMAGVADPGPVAGGK